LTASNTRKLLSILNLVKSSSTILLSKLGAIATATLYLILRPKCAVLVDQERGISIQEKTCQIFINGHVTT
jgi:hypothetical protein